MLRALKDAYFTAYLVFSRIGYQNKDAYSNKQNGVFGVTLIMCFLAFSLITWLEIAVHQEMTNKLIMVSAPIALYAFNYIVLIVRKSSSGFEVAFARFTENKKQVLFALTVMGSIALFSELLYCGSVYCGIFHPFPKPETARAYSLDWWLE
jgi:cytosine/uracil/thiamine/allantoin permease